MKNTEPIEVKATSADLAWCAGFIDGEGCLGIYNEKDKRKGNAYFHPRASLQVSNTDIGGLRKLHRCLWLCGSINGPQNRVKQNHKPQYRFTVRDQLSLVKILFSLLPFLQIKRTQAEYVLAFCISRQAKRGRGRYANFTANELRIQQRLLETNHRP